MVPLVCRALITMLVASAARATASERDVPCPPELAEVREFFVGSIERKQAPAASVVVVKDETTIWAEGFGYADLENRVKAHSDTIYLLASVSKPLTATGLMVLVDEGRIDLDKPANDYLPGAKLRAFAGEAEAMTVRRLANHTAGMPTHYNFFYNDVKPPSIDETIRRFGYAVYEPGTRWNYSNLAFGIIEYITEVVSGESWGRFMEKHVYDPLGMKGTSDRVRPEWAKEAARIYMKNAAGAFIPVAAYDFDHRGASAIWSSAHDLARFCRMHLNGGALDGARILSESATAEMQRRAYKIPGASETGVGWGLGSDRGHRFIGHSGGMPGVSTNMRAYPDDKLVFVVLTNASGGALVGGATERLSRALLPDGAPRAEGSNGPSGAVTKSIPVESVLGTWKGQLAHFNGDISVELIIESKDKASVKLGDGSRMSLDGLRFDGVLRGRMTGLLPVQASFHGLTVLNFSLEPAGERMTGTVFAVADYYFGISFWLDVERTEE